MDDEAKQLLREIRDLQKEHLELIRANVKEAEQVNRMALENHTQWKQQAKHSAKLMVIIIAIVIACLFALEILKGFR